MPSGTFRDGILNRILKGREADYAANYNDKIRAHLAELGFVVNADVTVVSKIGKNLILQVKESRIALDESMANRIMVEI